MRLTERLRVNGEDVPISGYSVNTPTDGLGQSVTIALAKPDVTIIPLDADIIFELGATAWDADAEEFVTSYASPIIANGKLMGRNYSIKWVPDERGGYPGDVIEFSSISPIADKWSISPPRPVILYDPQKVDPQTLIANPTEAIRYGGVPLLPLLIPQEDLNSVAVVNYCYGALGFTRIITNLGEPSPVERVDISMEGGYHEAAKAVISSQEPLVFEHDGILWIIDPEEGLPSGLTVKTLSPDAVVEVNQSLSPEITSNGVIVSYKNPGQINAGELPQEKYIDEEPHESGSGHSYTRQEVTRHITEFYDITTGELRRTEEHEVVTRNFAYRDSVIVTAVTLTLAGVYHIDGDGVVKLDGVVIGEGYVNPETGDRVISIDDFPMGALTNGETVTRRLRQEGGVVLISEDTIENVYESNNKSGHSRRVEGVYVNPEDYGRDAYGLLLNETNSLRYAPDDSHPGNSILSFSETKTNGLVLVETRPDGYIQYTPVLDAASGGLTESNATQSLQHDTPIETVTERLRPTSQNQANVETRIIDHLGGGLRTVPALQSRVGSRTTFNPPTPGNRPGYIRELIVDEDSVAAIGLRRPVSLDVGSCTAVDARRYARRRLQKITKPPKQLSITMPGIDYSLRRGSLILCPLREGFDNKAIVTGHKINASGIGTSSARRVQTLDARELVIDRP